ncbi:TPA: hypothetical protein ACXEMW_000591 [Proteus mirabilis]
MMEINWSLVVAVLSMIFTTFIGVVTIRYTSRSLAQNKKSNQLSEASLMQSRLNYKDQKSKLEQTEKDIQERNLLGMEIINGIFIDEVTVFITRFLRVINMREENNDVVEFDFYEKEKNYFFVFKDKDKNEIDAFNIWLLNVGVFYGYIFEASRISGKCLSDLKTIYDIYNESERLFRVYLFLMEEEHYRVYTNTNSNDFNNGLNVFLNDLNKIKQTLDVDDLNSYKN